MCVAGCGHGLYQPKGAGLGAHSFSRASWLTDSHHFSFCSQVEAVIHPRFLADLLSPEQQRDPLALIEELEQEERLSLAQVNLGVWG